MPSWSDRSSQIHGVTVSTWSCARPRCTRAYLDESLREFVEMSRIRKLQQRTYAITTANKFVCKITPTNPLPVIACGELVSGVFDFENTKPESMEIYASTILFMDVRNRRGCAE